MVELVLPEMENFPPNVFLILFADNKNTSKTKRLFLKFSTIYNSKFTAICIESEYRHISIFGHMKYADQSGGRNF